MTKTGVLLHVYNLGCKDWEELVWGDPLRNLLGTGTKLFECLLDEPASREVMTIIYNGPSSKDGITEGDYTRKFLLDRLARIDEFPRLRVRLKQLSDSERRTFIRRVESMIVGELIANTFDEIQYAAKRFSKNGAPRVIHIAAASHAPRCIQLQSVAREQGLIPRGQQWYTVASDFAFAGTSAADVMVLEPPHRADDPLIDFRPTLPQVLEPFYKLPGTQRKEFIRRAKTALHEITHNDVPD